MRQDEGPAGRRGGALDDLVGGMGDIDDDPEPVARAHHLDAKIGEAVMHRVFGLNVAEFVGPVMHELQVPQPELPPRFLNAIDVAACDSVAGPLRDVPIEADQVGFGFWAENDL